MLAGLSAVLVAGAAQTGSPGLTLGAFTVAVLCASAAWMSAYPTFSELFPTRLRATAIGACVGVGRLGAMLGVIVLAEAATAFGLWTAFVCLAGRGASVPWPPGSGG